MSGPRGTTAPRRTSAAAAAAAEQHSNTESQPGTDRVQQRPLSKPHTATGYIRRRPGGAHHLPMKVCFDAGIKEVSLPGSFLATAAVFGG